MMANEPEKWYYIICTYIGRVLVARVFIQPLYVCATCVQNLPLQWNDRREHDIEKEREREQHNANHEGSEMLYIASVDAFKLQIFILVFVYIT